MYHGVARTGMVLAGILLAGSLGCQTEKQQAAPGGLPSGVKADATPRLNASTYFAHAHLLERQGNFEQAVAQYRHALELSPSFVSGRNRLGIALNKLGRHAEASAEFRSAIRQSPTEAYLHNNLGFSLYLEGRYEEAAAALERAVELKPEFPRAHMNYGVVLAKLERYDEALAEFRLATNEADAYYNLAVLHTEAGQFAEAARALESALRLNPDFEAAREQLRVVAHLAAEVELAPVPQVASADAASSASAPVEAGAGEEYTLAAAEELAPATDRPQEPDESVGALAAEESAASVEPSAVDALDTPGDVRALLHELVAAAAQNLGDVYDEILCQLDELLAAPEGTSE